MNISKYVGNKIKYYRTQKNITQQELGEYLGIKSQTVSRYESGILEANQDILFKLAEYFKVSINDFFPPLEQYLSDSNEDNVNKTIFNKDGVKITVAHNGELNDKMLLEINNLLLNEKILKEELKESDARNAEK